MAVVVDASVILNWYFEEEGAADDALVRSLVDEIVVVPPHWQAELANGVLMGERRRRSTVAKAAGLLELVDTLTIEVDEEGASDALGRVLPLARAHRLTVYDAIYLELAERRGLSLATFDKELARAAASVNIQLVRPGVTE